MYTVVQENPESCTEMVQAVEGADSFPFISLVKDVKSVA